MFEKYTDPARRAIFFARYEASQCGSAAIEPEHILLGLLREDQALILRFVEEGVTAESLREVIKKEAAGEKLSTSVELPLSLAAKRDLAYAHSDALSRRVVGIEHLLLGLLRDERSLASRVLRQSGVKVEDVRQRIG